MRACSIPAARPGRCDAVAPDILWRYCATAFPRARRELRRWQRRARAIPDPTLRAHACTTLREEHGNAEGAALLALAAPRERRAVVVRLLVAVQVLYDYLDTLSEQPAAAHPLAASRRLHGALLAVLASGPDADWYAGYRCGDDGGYLGALVATCRTQLAALPSQAVAAPGVRRAMERAAECQSRNHAAMLGALPRAALAEWALAQAPDDVALRWWELAAAAGSSLAIHALLAAAADPRLTPAAAEQLERAYWPWVCGLNTLLESVADAAADAVSGNHSYVARYGAPDVAAARIAALAGRATAAVRTLPDATHHATVLAAMACFYLEAPRPPAPTLRHDVLAQLDLDARALRALALLRRRLG